MSVDLKDLVSPLSPSQITFWLSRFHSEAYPSECVLFYRKHYPHGAYIVLEGGLRIEFKHQRKTVLSYIQEPAILGVEQVLKHVKLGMSVMTAKPSKLIFIPRMTLIRQERAEPTQLN